MVRVHTDSVQLFWFTPNPETYGSASTSFHVQYQGNGFSFEDDAPEAKEKSLSTKGSQKDKESAAPVLKPNMVEVALEEATTHGAGVVKVFEQIHQRFLNTRKKLRKSEVFSMLTRQSPEEEKAFSLWKELSSELIFQVYPFLPASMGRKRFNYALHLLILLRHFLIIPRYSISCDCVWILQLLERSRDRTHVPVSMVYGNLHPGYLYSFRARGVNRVGCGAYSEPTLTTSTKADLPHTPARPTLVHSTLRSLTLQWAPPEDDGGTAITGYTLHLLTEDRFIDVGRSTISYVWEGLFPGRSYRLRVRAVNSVGISDFSEPNRIEESYTSTAPPEPASPAPLAVMGTWNELRYEVIVPYSNGAPIDAMLVNMRLITPFSVGNWEVPSRRPLYPLRHLLYRSDDSSVTSESKGSRSGGTHRSASVRSLASTGSKTSESSLDVVEDFVEVVDFVDTVKQQEQLEHTVRELEMLRSTTGFNPYKADKNKLEQEIEALIHKQVRPHAPPIHFPLSAQK